MEKKLYYAYVAEDVADYFEEKAKENDVEIVLRESAISNEGKPAIYYELKAEEGIIDPKWELK